METAKYLIERLLEEKAHKISGGVYHKLQVDMAYNSNHMEGSRLSHEQTQYIFDTQTVFLEKPGEAVRVDDIVETSNHFRCLDYVLDNYREPLTEKQVLTLHRILKEGTVSARAKEAVIGGYKKYPNFVGTIETSRPENVQKDIRLLLSDYKKEKTPKNLTLILDFHAKFERIHPFYDGNGRVGRLLLLRECLRNDIVPFVIRDEIKAYYLRGLREWQTGGEKGYLLDTCLSMQDEAKAVLRYFEIPYEEPEREPER